MVLHQIRTLGISLACAAGLLGCAHGPNHDRGGIETPEDLIGAVATLAGTDESRLHPEYVWTTLVARADDPKVDAAFDMALRNKENQEYQVALLRVLEEKFIHDPEMSVIDLMGPELSEHFRDFEWDPADYPGGPEGPNEKLADVMVDVLDLIRPERRANRTRDAVLVKTEATEDRWDFITAQWEKVPDQEDWMLNHNAVESFVRMREAAKADGVELVILSGHRLRKVAERNAARANNSNAVASFSAHSLGLAIDFQMSQEGLEFSEITTRPMAEVVRMRESPVHKWLCLRGDEFGWYPYQNEPWHWEYNPPGFMDIFWAGYPEGPPVRAADFN